MYNKISIIGGPGSGKTTLSNALSEKYNILTTHIDAIHHLKDWKIRDKSERDKIILDIVKKEKWIIDGTYRNTLQTRLEHSDLIIWLDYSTFSQLKGIIKRFIRNFGRERKDIPGCKERLNFQFIKDTITYNKTKRRFVINCLEVINQDNIFIFKKQKDLNKWLKDQHIDITKKLD